MTHQNVAPFTTVRYMVPGPEGGQESYDITPYVENAQTGRSQPHAYCHDRETKTQLVGTIAIVNGEPQCVLHWEPSNDKTVTGLSIVYLKLADGRYLYFVIKDDYITGSIDKCEQFERRRYWYEEHTCVTNWLPQVQELLLDGYPDPHGAFTLEHVFTADEVFEKTGVKLEDYLNASTNMEPNAHKFFQNLVPGLMAK